MRDGKDEGCFTAVHPKHVVVSPDGVIRKSETFDMVIAPNEKITEVLIGRLLGTVNVLLTSV